MICSFLEVKNNHIFSFMSIHHIGKNNELSDTLVTFLEININMAHIKLISLFIVALCNAKRIFFYSVDIVTEFLLGERNEYKIPIFDFLAIANQMIFFRY